MSVIFNPNFTTAQETKLAGIEAGAEVNVNADWNASSGDAQILNKPTIVTDHTGLSSIGTNTHAQIDTHIASTTNPHSVTKTQVGLGNVANADTTTTANITDSSNKRFITDAQQTVLNNTSGVNTGDQNLFQTIAVSGQNNVVADSTTDTLTLVAGSNITITTDASTDSITIASAGGVANLAYTASSTQGTITSDTGTDATIPAADGTNAGLFLPAEKTKLAGIAAGAEVNVNADWNASSGDAQILNKPTLGTAAATNSTDYATAAQGTKADTAVQPAAIGSTVLAFDSNLQSFVNAFTLPTTDGTAGQSLVTNGAGVISFATPAILADPAYIAGVAYFNRSTKPTERSAGVPLVVGDHWYNTSDGTEGFWNGTYWLSLTEFLLSIPEIVGQTADQVIPGSSAATTGSIFVDKLVHQTAVLNSTNTATNYWTLAVQVSGVSATTISTQNATNYPHQEVSLGLVIPARSAIPTGGSVVFTGLSQTFRLWHAMTTLGTDVYACVNGGDIYKQTNGTGNFLPLGQTSRGWVGMTTLGTDVYASVNAGDIYKQTNGTGNFLPLSQTSRLWVGMTTLGTDVYASVYAGDIYKQTNGTGNFLPLGQTSRIWRGMTTLGTDVYASVDGGDIYKTSWFIDTVGHSARVTTTRVGTQTTSLYSAMSLTYRKVL